MIRSVLYRTDNGDYTAFEAHGHAEYADYGNDIVCAAVSVLGTACVNSLESVCGVIATVLDDREGSLVFTLPNGLTEQQNHNAQILLAALKQGMTDVSEQFPQNLRFDIKPIKAFKPSVSKIGGKRQ